MLSMGRNAIRQNYVRKRIVYMEVLCGLGAILQAQKLCCRYWEADKRVRQSDQTQMINSFVFKVS